MGSGHWGGEVLGVHMFCIPLCFWTAEVEESHSMSWDSIPGAGALGSAVCHAPFPHLRHRPFPVAK